MSKRISLVINGYTRSSSIFNYQMSANTAILFQRGGHQYVSSYQYQSSIAPAPSILPLHVPQHPLYPVLPSCSWIIQSNGNLSDVLQAQPMNKTYAKQYARTNFARVVHKHLFHEISSHHVLGL